ncbi:MAG: nucleotide-binding universal stress UspA family protein [Hyphomicrobiaceae bacterium]|jgi:nucleotide-binding universal stress UspA family protein
MYDHILIATDGSEYSEQAVVEGAKLAKVLGSKITIVTAVQTEAPLIAEGQMIGADLRGRREHATSKAKDILSSALNIAVQVNVPVETECVLDMTPYDAIIETAKAKSCDLIVMASHGRSGLSALLLGSETQKVLTHSTIPVLVHRRDA